MSADGQPITPKVPPPAPIIPTPSPHPTKPIVPTPNGGKPAK